MGDTNVHEKLISEIERMSAKRERWKGYAREAQQRAVFAPAIALMDLEIGNAKAALADDDGIKCISALVALGEYDDND